MRSAVLLIAFNRADLTEQTLKRIIEANPSKIYFAVDGARQDKKDEFEKVKKVKELISIIPNSIELKTKFSDSNQGCRLGVTSAISWFFSQEEFGIILEDDCYPDLSFFDYCDALLHYYKDNEKIGMISGDNFFKNQIRIEDSYFFSDYFHIWGWASWRRAWNGYKSDNLDINLIKKVTKRKLKNYRAIKFWNHWISDSANGLVDTWDHQWTFHNWLNNRVSIMPHVNLITNLGFRNDGTHTLDENSKFANLLSESIKFPLRHPRNIEVRNFYQEFVKIFFYPSLLRNLLFKIRIFIYKMIKK